MYVLERETNYATQCTVGYSIRGVWILVSHYTDTHLYVFSLTLTLPLIINSYKSWGDHVILIMGHRSKLVSD
jgi:hypothetical protein